MALNVTNITQINSLYDMGNYAAASTNGIFWAIILIVLYLVMIMRLRLEATEDSIMAASFVCLILSVLFMQIGFLQIIWPIFFAVSLAGSAFFKIYKPK